MVSIREKLCIYLGALLLLFSPAHSRAANIGFVDTNLWLSDDTPVENVEVTIFALIVNSSDKALKGSVIFRTGNTDIGTPKPFLLQPGGTSNVITTSWIPNKGSGSISASISSPIFIDAFGNETPAPVSAINAAAQNISVQPDDDADALGNAEEEELGTNPQDPDSDDDGLQDGDEKKLGTDPNDSDTDDDGQNDSEDANPLQADTDQDGIPDEIDSDDDNDGLFDFEEEKLGTDPRVFDSDRDGVSDSLDPYPHDPQNAPPNEIRPPQTDQVSEDFVPEVLGEQIEREPLQLPKPNEAGLIDRFLLKPWWFKSLVALITSLLVTSVIALFMWKRAPRGNKTTDEQV